MRLSLLVVLVAVGGCDEFNTIKGLWGAADPLVGTWRYINPDAGVEARTGERMTFHADGTVRLRQQDTLDPVLDKDLAGFFRAWEHAHATYSRSAKMLVISVDMTGVKKAVAAMRKPGTDTDAMKGDTLDIVSSYVLSGDILETTTGGKTSTYVRVK